MTIHFPDVSPFQGGISLAGAVAAALKTTEGAGWSAGKWFTDAVARAHASGTYPVAYHFLHQGNAAGQAGWCNSRDGGLPLMLDLEPTGSSHPTVSDGTGFIDAYRRAGGICNLLYLPHWYWQQMGSPSLAPFAQRKMALWSSAYTAYSDQGPGWAGYGGMNVTIWQHTDKQAFNSQHVDFSAFKGTKAQLIALATGGAPVPAADPHPLIKMGDSGPAVTRAQNRLNTHGAARPPLDADGDFGQKTHDATRQFQLVKDLPRDGVIGPVTWARLEAKPNQPAPAPNTKPPAHGPHHGPWISAGQLSLRDLAKSLGYPVNTIIRMTAVHYGWFDPGLAGYLAGLVDGSVAPTAHLPKGAALWCN